jgi:hypothetical protein
MPKLQVTFFRHRIRLGILAVAPVSTNLVFFEPDDWESDRQVIIDPDLARRVLKSRFGWERFDDLAIASWNRCDILERDAAQANVCFSRHSASRWGGPSQKIELAPLREPIFLAAGTSMRAPIFY